MTEDQKQEHPEGQPAASSDEREQAPASVEKQPVDANIAITFGENGMQLAVTVGTNHKNPAVHFAQWVGENVQALVLLAEPGYHAMMEAEAAGSVGSAPGLVLVDSMGGKLQ